VSQILDLTLVHRRQRHPSAISTVVPTATAHWHIVKWGIGGGEAGGPPGDRTPNPRIKSLRVCAGSSATSRSRWAIRCLCWLECTKATRTSSHHVSHSVQRGRGDAAVTGPTSRRSVSQAEELEQAPSGLVPPSAAKAASLPQRPPRPTAMIVGLRATGGNLIPTRTVVGRVRDARADSGRVAHRRRGWFSQETHRTEPATSQPPPRRSVA
jgi:hypothetical protein